MGPSLGDTHNSNSPITGVDIFSISHGLDSVDESVSASREADYARRFAALV
jgi:hypothetical protein